MPTYPVVPFDIVVHLGTPNSNAQNVTVAFPTYVKNVASGEIYPSWPESSLRANIYAIITFALNRVYTEWYKSRGYPFDITSSTAYDQSFSLGRDIFENISDIVDGIFNNYVVKGDDIQPYFTQFCNGTTVTCNGLSQWGTVSLAESGYTPYQILRYYYGDDINIRQNAPVANIPNSYPDRPLQVGSASNEVRLIQIQLNRIANNYPAIPKISPTDGIFRTTTQEAVRKFQQIFNLTPDGIVGKDTWYKIKYIYNGVKGLGELSSEGVTLEEVRAVFPETLRPGLYGNEVRALQYYLNVIAYFNEMLTPIAIDGVYGPATTSLVEDFQRYYGLTPDGIVGRSTWNMIDNVYRGIVRTLSQANSQQGQVAKVYPGYILSLGQSGPDVADLQTYLSTIGKTYTDLPVISVTGEFGAQTENAVRAFQQLFGIPVSGSVGAVTWNAIANEYNQLTLNGLRT